MGNQKAGKKFAGKNDIIYGGPNPYREAEVSLAGPGSEPVAVRYKPLSTREIIEWQDEIGDPEKLGDPDAPESNIENLKKVAELLADHLVDEDGKTFVTQEELLDAPVDTLTALMGVMTPDAPAEAVEAEGNE